MRRFAPFVLGLSAVLVFSVPGPAHAQLSDVELMARVTAAGEASTDAYAFLLGAEAARLMGDMELADEYLDRSMATVGGLQNLLINEMIMNAMANGEGANGMLRALREARARWNLPPIQVAAVANNYPTLLTGGELDEMILSMSSDHPDPAYRCACYAQKAWVHRVAGRDDEAVEQWRLLAEAREQNPMPAGNAQAQGQYARDLARAGRTDEARQVLAAAMQMEVSEEARPGVQRRWAQAYAELGEVEEAVALLEPLLESSTLVSVESLSTRYTWEPIRDHPSFQAMLDRHR